MYLDERSDIQPPARFIVGGWVVLDACLSVKSVFSAS